MPTNALDASSFVGKHKNASLYRGGLSPLSQRFQPGLEAFFCGEILTGLGFRVWFPQIATSKASGCRFDTKSIFTGLNKTFEDTTEGSKLVK